MGRGTRWFLVLVAVLVLLLAGHTVWLTSSRRSFEERLRVARADTPAATPAPERPDENAASLLERAVEAAGPYPLADMPKDNPDDWSDSDRAALENWVANAEEAFQLIETAAGCARCDFSDEAGNLLPDLTTLHRLLSCRVALGRGGIETVTMQFDLAAQLDRPTILVAAVRHQLLVFALGNLRRLARAEDFDAEAAGALFGPLLAAELETDDLVAILRAERAFGLGWIDKWASGEYDAGHKLHGVELGQEIQGWLARPLAYRDARKYIEVSAEAIRIAEEDGDLEAFRDRIAQLPDHYPLTRSYARLPTIAQELVERHRERIRVARAGLAALAHHQALGDWPADVERRGELILVSEGEAEWILSGLPPEDR
ncbi:MAG: hypothetical protein ACYTGN_05860 [Planctomycetota bacterium]|jgi:hypothetical protein